MPLTFDMSLAELETYQGRNPRPDDFDTFWEDALAEMRDVDPQIEISPASFQTPVAECSDLYFTGCRRCAGSRYAASVRITHPAPTQRC